MGNPDLILKFVGGDSLGLWLNALAFERLRSQGLDSEKNFVPLGVAQRAEIHALLGAKSAAGLLAKLRTSRATSLHQLEAS